MNTHNPRPRFGPGIPLLFGAVAALALPALALTFASVDPMGPIGNACADELAGTGLFTFAAAMRRSELDCDRFYVTMPVDRHPADEAVACYQTAARAFRQGALQDTAPAACHP